MTPEECIELIRQLPDTRLEAHGIRIGYSYRKDDDSLVLAAAREEYLAKSQWLEFFWLSRISLSDELTQTWKIHYKPHFYRTDGIRRLAEEIYLRLAWMKDEKLSPLELTLACETQICETKLINSGYIANSASNVGKRENYNNALKYYAAMEVADRKIFERGEFWLYPMQALEMSGAFLASTDLKFKNTQYRDYLRSQKRYHREMGKGQLNVIHLDQDGVTEMIGQGNSHGSRLGQSK